MKLRPNSARLLPNLEERGGGGLSPCDLCLTEPARHLHHIDNRIHGLCDACEAMLRGIYEGLRAERRRFT